MTNETLASARPVEALWSPPTLMAVGGLVALVIAGDVLIYGHAPGIGISIFFLAVAAVVLGVNRARLAEPRITLLTFVAVLSALPFAETDVIAWFPMALGAVSLLALAASGLLPAFEDWLGRIVRFAVLAPFQLVLDSIGLLGFASVKGKGRSVFRGLLAWLVPLAAAAVFALLFVSANPVFEDGFRYVRLDVLLRALQPARIVLWGFIAMICWPLLVPRLLPWTGSPGVVGPVLPRAESFVFGAAAIRNSLVVCNVLFAMQTAMDFAYLWGGLRLPDGISYAEYAHRGAFPLVLAAMLAAAFVLAAMRRGGTAERSPLIRGLVYVFVAQTIWLVISSILRLKLYVEVYSLTELRIAAGLWMGLVAVGLVLIVARIALGLSNRWLVMANLSALALTLFAVSWLDFPATIAWFNVEHAPEMGQAGAPLDVSYLRELGPGAIPAIDGALAAGTAISTDEARALRIVRDELAAAVRPSADWQGWTWRGARLAAYVAAHPLAPDGHAR